MLRVGIFGNVILDNISKIVSMGISSILVDECSEYLPRDGFTAAAALSPYVIPLNNFKPLHILFITFYMNLEDWRCPSRKAVYVIMYGSYMIIYAIMYGGHYVYAIMYVCHICLIMHGLYMPFFLP